MASITPLNVVIMAWESVIHDLMFLSTFPNVVSIACTASVRWLIDFRFSLACITVVFSRVSPVSMADATTRAFVDKTRILCLRVSTRSFDVNPVRYSKPRVIHDGTSDRSVRRVTLLLGVSPGGARKPSLSSLYSPRSWRISSLYCLICVFTILRV